jgi:hypothetical protein
MPAFDPMLQKAVLDWMLGGATPTRPTTWWIDFATGTPNTSGGSSGPIPRKTVTFAAANSPQMSATLVAAVTCTATAAATVVGWNLWGSSAGGTRIAFGSITSSQASASGGLFSFGAGALKITLT